METTIANTSEVALPAAIAAALVCPECRGALTRGECPGCGERLRVRDGVFSFEDETKAAKHQFATYSMDSGVPQYAAGELVEHEYYLRFLPNGVRLMIDLGGGDANASAVWARRNPQAALLLADMDGHALAKAARRKLPNLIPLQASALTVPVAAGSADVVFSTFVVEHLYDWELSDFYTEAWRLLAPGGRLVIQSDAPIFDKFIHPVLRLLRQGNWRTSNFLERWKTSVRAIDHHNLKTAREQATLIERHGFFLQGVEVPLLFSNNSAAAAAYEVLAGVMPVAWLERVFGTSYTIVARKPVPPERAAG